MSTAEEREAKTIMGILKRKSASSSFVNGQVRGDAFSQLLKKLRVTGSSKNAVAMFVTNTALFEEITVPAGCPTLDQTFLAKQGDWRMIVFTGDERLMTVASCPFTRNSKDIDPDEPEHQEYVSPIYMLAVEHLAKIGNRFNGGFINISTVDGDKFEFSQSTTDRFGVRGAGRIFKPTLLCVDCVLEDPVGILNTIQNIWEFYNEQLSLPYRFTSNSSGGGGFGKSSGDSELMRFKYISFNCEKKWMGDGVLEGDTNEQGADSFCTQFNAIRDEMFNEGDVNVSDGSSAKRRKRMTKEEREKEEDERLDAQLAALNEEDFELPAEEEEEEGTSEIAALLEKRAKTVQRVETTEARPVIEALPSWFRALWSLEQSSKKVAEFSCGTSTITASCQAEIVLPGSAVKAINDLCAPGNIASTYFVPSKSNDHYKNLSMLVVMSHSLSNDVGVTSVTIVTPFAKPE